MIDRRSSRSNRERMLEEVGVSGETITSGEKWLQSDVGTTGEINVPAAEKMILLEALGEAGAGRQRYMNEMDVSNSIYFLKITVSV